MTGKQRAAAAECGTTGAPPKTDAPRITADLARGGCRTASITAGVSAGTGGTEVRLTRYRHRKGWHIPATRPRLSRLRALQRHLRHITPGTGALDPGCENLVHHLCDHGFDVWLVDYRTSIALDSCKDRWDYD
ncbi:MAG: hypothetical protein IPK20_13450 [Betaproteobacteria bacterium]|nr:hypothetical protein [Betaproteobacteria bacterium]